MPTPRENDHNSSPNTLEIEQQSLLPSTHDANTTTNDTATTNIDAVAIAPPKHPLYVWPLLIASILAVSSAGTVFVSMKDVPPITLASWRLHLTWVILTILALFQIKQLQQDILALPPSHPQYINRDSLSTTVVLLLLSGTSLAFHFGLWVVSLQRTSLSHSLVLVCSTPIWVTLASWITKKPLSRGEIGGAVLGVVGAAVLGLGVTSGEQHVTLLGDVAAILASVALTPYLMIGRRLRQWMPVFIYAAPVTATGAFILSIAAVVGEEASLFGSGERGLIGWLMSTSYLIKVIYLALGPGLVGHTGFNALLKYFSPLTIALAVNQEPFIGSLIGWAAAVAPLPGVFTFIGGGVIMCSTILVTIAAHSRQKRHGSDSSRNKGNEADDC